jgi:5'-methylthioinosine phosphorylase
VPYRKTVALIGGTGLAYGLERILSDTEIHRNVDVRFGSRSGTVLHYLQGSYGDIRVIILPRHGPTLELPDRSPAELVQNLGFEAHIWHLHEIGVEAIYAFNAVGALDRDVPLASEGTFLVPDQFGRGLGATVHSFGALAKVVHPSMAQPFSAEHRQHLVSAITSAGAQPITRGLYIHSGPDCFETDAEIVATSRLYQDFRNRVVGMTAGAELVLCRQMEIPYALICANSNYAQGLAANTPVDHPLVLSVMSLASPTLVRIAEHLLRSL